MLRNASFTFGLMAFLSLLAGCQTVPAGDDEICSKAMSTRTSYLQCLTQKESGACEHLLRLYQADAQVFASSGCVRPMSGAKRPPQSPTW